MRTEGQKQSQKHEARMATAVGGTVRPGSGAFATAKGDVRQGRDDSGSSLSSLLIEHKWTGKKTVTIKSDVLEKICDEALLEGRRPALGLHLNGRDYVVMEEDDLLEIVEGLRG